MITYAKLKHLENEKFKELHKEIKQYHEKVDYFFDWSRQWEYPWLLENVPLKKTDIVLDVGGGTCHFPALVAERVKKVVVGELYSERVWNKSTKNVEYLNLDIMKPSFNSKFDVVFCISVLEHVENYIEAIKNITNFVKKGGYLAMTLDLFLDNTRNCRKEDIDIIINILSDKFDIGDVDLIEENLYEKMKLQEMKLNMPNLYSNNYKNRTSLGIVVKKL